MEVKMKTSLAILRNIGFEKVYSTGFKYYRRNEGTEAIYCHPFMGAVIYIMSVGNIVWQARMVIEASAEENFHSSDFIGCKYYKDKKIVHLAYDMRPVLETESKLEAQRFLEKIMQELNWHKEWQIIPDERFLSFIDIDIEPTSNIWNKVQVSKDMLKKIWGIHS